MTNSKAQPVSKVPPKVIFNPRLPDGRVIRYYPLVGWRAE